MYDNFKEFLNNHDYLIEDGEGQLLDVDNILKNKESFIEFRDGMVSMDRFNDINFEDINKPILFGEATEVMESNMHFEAVENIKDESDLINFINDVLREHGEVTHSTGSKSEYEVAGISEE